MWRRSDIEQLTGLSKRKIQELCHQNKATGGIAFWTPYESRPGYSQFDKNDLAVFYVVEKIHSSGFSLAETNKAFGLFVFGEESNSDLVKQKREELLDQIVELTRKVSNLDLMMKALADSKSQRLAVIFKVMTVHDFVEIVRTTSCRECHRQTKDIKADYEIDALLKEIIDSSLFLEIYKKTKIELEKFIANLNKFRNKSCLPNSEETMNYVDKTLFRFMGCSDETTLEVTRRLFCIQGIQISFEILGKKGFNEYLQQIIRALICFKSKKFKNL